MTVGDSRFTEDQRTEAFRTELMQHQERQTKAAEATRNSVHYLLLISAALAIALVLAIVAANS